MELDKIRNLTDEELGSQQTKAAEQLFRLRFQKSLGNQEGIKKLRGLKLDIARIQTIARERTLAAGKPAAAVVAVKPVAVVPAAKARVKRTAASAAAAPAEKAPSPRKKVKKD